MNNNHSLTNEIETPSQRMADAGHAGRTREVAKAARDIYEAYIYVILYIKLRLSDNTANRHMS